MTKKGKSSPRYLGPYKVVRRVRKMAYELELPMEINMIHPIFHVLMLRKFVGDPNSIVPWDVRIEEN